MPRWRATLPCPTRVELYRATMAAAALLALTASAFPQASKQNTVVLNTLQPHSVRTSLRSYRREAGAAQMQPAAQPSQARKSPRTSVSAKASSAEASIAACNTYIKATSRRWDVLAPAFSRRAEAYRAARRHRCRHRGLRSRDQDRSEKDRQPPGPRLGLSREARHRSRHPRFQPGHQSRPAPRRRDPEPGPGLPCRRQSQARDSRTTTF